MILKLFLNKKSFWKCYQKDFYSLNYNLRLTHPLSATIGNRAHILAHHSFHNILLCCCRFHFVLFLYLNNLSFWYLANLSASTKKASAVCRGFSCYILNLNLKIKQ